MWIFHIRLRGVLWLTDLSFDRHLGQNMHDKFLTTQLAALCINPMATNMCCRSHLSMFDYASFHCKQLSFMCQVLSINARNKAQIADLHMKISRRQHSLTNQRKVTHFSCMKGNSRKICFQSEFFEIFLPIAFENLCWCCESTEKTHLATERLSQLASS